MTTPQVLLESLFHAFMAKDLSAVMAHFAENAVVYDPHYPQPSMHGKVEIERGLAWGLSSLVKPGFAIRKTWMDGDSIVVELDTHHILRGGMETRFDQVFVIETRQGKITRLQSYVPYAPHGIAGLLSKVTRLAWRLQGKLR